MHNCLSISFLFFTKAALYFYSSMKSSAERPFYIRKSLNLWINWPCASFYFISNFSILASHAWSNMNQLGTELGKYNKYKGKNASPAGIKRKALKGTNLNISYKILLSSLSSKPVNLLCFLYLYYLNNHFVSL